MSAWQRPIRVALALFVTGVGVAVALGLRGRTAPAPALVAERSDPDAVIQTLGSRIVQADEQGENLRVVADRQDTYRDGALRLIDNVEVTVADRHGRAGFVLTGQEAHLDSRKTEVQLTGDVRMQSTDGLLATTDEAAYSDTVGIVRMPTFTTFRRDGLEAIGDQAQYDRRADVLRLLASAQVDLMFDTTRFRIVSRRAMLSHADSYMQFDGDVKIDAGLEEMTAGQVRAMLVGESTQMESLELRRSAFVVGRREQAGALREMSADIIRLAYGESGKAIETAVLTGGATLTTIGADGADGARIGGRLMDISLDPARGALRELVARGRVRVDLPQRADVPARQISAERLSATSTTGSQLEEAEFEGDVVFEETPLVAAGRSASRVLRARQLHTTLADGFAELADARFLGQVTLEDDGLAAVADEAVYAVTEGRIELTATGPDARTPRFEDERGSVQARSISLAVEKTRVAAEGDVKSVLTIAQAVSEGAGRNRPSVLSAEEPVYITAGQFTYDGELETAVYTGDARLWQGETEFAGDEIVLDEALGNIAVEGNVRTRTLMTQVNDETGLPEESMTIGRARQFVFEDAIQRATYTTDAQVTSPRSNLAADLIHLILLSDGRTLERLEAVGNVQLKMAGRWVSGESLVYYDAEGRYEMDGEPVEIVEELDGECRETTGRRLTFFLTNDAVSVDGESEVRTQTARGACAEFTR